MKTKVIGVLVAAITLFAGKSFGKEDPVLLEINGSKVTKSEFHYIYEKNNQDEEGLYTEEQVRDYLDRFKDFKLKVHEAKQQGLDTTEDFRSEFEEYKNELAQPYLTDEEAIEELVREAYERSKELVRASHILVRDEDDPEDTLEAYEKLDKIKEKYHDNRDFNELAVEYSEDPSVEQNQGDLGFFGAFDMAYPFEEKAYNTEPGEVAGPFKTEFGYHLIKVHERKTHPGEVDAGHVMIGLQQRRITPEEGEEIADSVYDQIQDGMSFEEAAQQYSDDQQSARRGGRLNTFSYTERQLPRDFIDKAFELEEGEISEPIQTSFGWHIVKKFEEHPLPSYEEKRNELEQRVKNSERIKEAEKAALQSFKEEHDFSESSFQFWFFERSTGVDESLLEGEWEFDEGGFLIDRSLFSVGDKSFSRRDFAHYMQNNQEEEKYADLDKAIDGYYEEFVENKVRQYHEENLEKHYPEYRNVLAEYRDGLLLFDIMEQEVWDKANEDTAGLKHFFEENIDQYREENVGLVFRYRLNTIPEDFALKDMEQEDRKAEVESLKEEGKINKDTLHLNQQHWQDLPETEDFKEGSWAFREDGNPVFYRIEEIKEEGVPDLARIRGRVSSDYQDKLEREWVESLHKKYEVALNEDVLREIIEN